MGRNIDDVIAGLPKARRDRIETKAVRLASEMIEHADSLGDIRKAMSKTQSEIARELIGRAATSRRGGQVLAQQLGYDPALAQPALLAIAFELLAQLRGQSDSKCHDETKTKTSLYTTFVRQ